MSAGLIPMSWDELAALLARLKVAPDGTVTFTLAREEAMWLVNAGLSEARRSGDTGRAPAAGATRQ